MMSNTNTSREALLAGDPAEDGTFTENPIPKVDRPFWRSMVPRRALEAHDARKQLAISREAEAEAEFLAGAPAKDATFTENPTKVDRPFWRYMVARRTLGPRDARKQFDLPPPSDGTKNPIFTFNRYLATATDVPDGRTIYIGGQQHDPWHEGPDDYVYNDVVVMHRYRRPVPTREDLKTAVLAVKKIAKAHDFDIYSYPLDIFPATFLHRATYYKHEPSGKEYIYIIGGLGDSSKSPHERATATMVYRLDLQDYSIRKIETTGDAPPVCRKYYEREYYTQRSRLTWVDGDGIVLTELREVFRTVERRTYYLSLSDMHWSSNVSGIPKYS